MTEQHGQFTQIAFFFDPKLDPIKDNIKSFVVLKTLMSSEKPMSVDEVKKTCSEEYKIGLESNELVDIIEKWYACIDRKNEGIMLTEQGRELMLSVEEESKRIQTGGFEWFIGEMSKSVDKEKIKNEEDNLKRFFMKCVFRASEGDVNILKGMSGVADRPLIDATVCIRRLNKDQGFTKFDEDIKKSFASVIRKLFDNPSDERINRFMYALQYTSLIRLVLPSGEIVNILKKDLANKKFCFDSNTILGAIFHHDHSHYLIYDTFSKLKHFNNGNLSIFWHKDTYMSVMDVLEDSKKFCENMEFFPEEPISNISLVASKSPVREYFKENWANWRSFEKYYMDRYRQLKRHDTYTKNNMYLFMFSWDNVPGNDSERLIRFLRDNLNIDWAENVEIRKNDDGKTIRIFKDEKSVEIIIDEMKEKATLKISDGRIHDLKVKKENGKLNIYNNIDNIEINKNLLKSTMKFFRLYLEAERIAKKAERRSKSNKELAHDSQLLVWVHLLRQYDTSEHITPNYWIVTMDNSLINFEKKFRKTLFSSEEYPLCVSRRALHLLLDPYFIANSTEIEEEFDRTKLGISATMKGILNVEPFYTIKKLNDIYNSRPNEQIHLIGQYLDEQNLRDVTI